MKEMGKKEITLTLQQLYIIDHAIRDRLKRARVSESDKVAENETLDTVNSGIRSILRRI